jgi:hypothetical protein
MLVPCTPALICASTLYFSLHLGLYVTVFRKLSAFRLERRILFYHSISAIVFSTLVLIFGIVCGGLSTLATAVGVIFVHGIYSLSFLELWSLAQGSYSITILIRVLQSGTVPRSQVQMELADIGQHKKEDRLSALAGFRLLHREGRALRLTPRGRLVSHGLKCFVWLTNPKEIG